GAPGHSRAIGRTCAGSLERTRIDFDSGLVSHRMRDDYRPRRRSDAARLPRVSSDCQPMTPNAPPPNPVSQSIERRERYVSRLTRNTYALILAGGRGSRLLGLTDWRAKPAVPFGGKFRIIDFPLSNC